MTKRPFPGRPTVAASPGTRSTVSLRLTAPIKDMIDAAAKAKGRPFSHEAEFRLESSFEKQSLSTEVAKLGDRMLAVGEERAAMQAEIDRLRARVKELEGQHKALVLNNSILRERPDLPLNRIPAARAMTKLYEENERLLAALEKIGALDDQAECCGRTGSGDGNCCNQPEYGLDRAKIIARAALEGSK